MQVLAQDTVPNSYDEFSVGSTAEVRAGYSALNEADYDVGSNQATDFEPTDGNYAGIFSIAVVKIHYYHKFLVAIVDDGYLWFQLMVVVTVDIILYKSELALSVTQIQRTYAKIAAI